MKNGPSIINYDESICKIVVTLARKNINLFANSYFKFLIMEITHLILQKNYLNQL